MIAEIKAQNPAILAALEPYQYTYPSFKQTLSETELVDLVGQYDYWIIGDDPVTEQVVLAGLSGQLKAAVKWGVGTDNVDFAACKLHELPISHTPGVFGEEVSDVAVGYMLALARHLATIDRSVRTGSWLKIAGQSLSELKAAVIGYGDIGQCTVRKLNSFNFKEVVFYDPFHTDKPQACSTVEQAVNQADYIIVCCALNPSTHKLVNKELLSIANKGVRLVNVARGPVVDHTAVVELQQSNHIYAVALDVFDPEPFDPVHNPVHQQLASYPQNIFGSHNGSNTKEAVTRVSLQAVAQLRLA